MLSPYRIIVNRAAVGNEAAVVMAITEVFPRAEVVIETAASREELVLDVGMQDGGSTQSNLRDILHVLNRCLPGLNRLSFPPAPPCPASCAFIPKEGTCGIQAWRNFR